MYAEFIVLLLNIAVNASDPSANVKYDICLMMKQVTQLDTHSDSAHTGPVQHYFTVCIYGRHTTP
jgi:hypothetical protein